MAHRFPPHAQLRSKTLVAVSLACLLAACGGGSDDSGLSMASASSAAAEAVSASAEDRASAEAAKRTPKFETLDGKQPIVIAHRGASGYFPEHTLPAYSLAIAFGADVIEPDVVVSKDGVLIVRHDVMLKATTNVADKPEFASRKRNGENGDGEAVTDDWFVEDFTAAELKTLRARSPNHPKAAKFDDWFPLVTLQEVFDLAKKMRQLGSKVGVYPETKAPSYFKALYEAGKIPVRLEDALVKKIKANKLNRHDAPIYVQSFEPTSLQYMRSIGSKVKQVQLIDAYDVDFVNGTMVYGTAPGNLVYSQPTDWKLAGRSELFDSMLTPAGLAQIKTYADGIGPWKPMVVPVKCRLDTAGKCQDLDGDGTFNGYADAEQQAPTSLVADAHDAGLFVHEYTFRSELGYYNRPFEARKNVKLEYLTHYRTGVDGVFSDVADTALAARRSYVKEVSR